MIPFATAAARSKRSRCEKRSKRGWRRANWNCTRKRRRSCTARTITEWAPIRCNSSISWALRLEPPGQKTCEGEVFFVRVSGRRGGGHKGEAPSPPPRRHHLPNTPPVGGWGAGSGPIITGWMNYYGHFQRSALIPVFRPLDLFLLRWARRKYRLFRSARMKTRRWLNRVRARQPLLFPHWVLEGRLNNGSRMHGDVHVRF